MHRRPVLVRVIQSLHALMSVALETKVQAG